MYDVICRVYLSESEFVDHSIDRVGRVLLGYRLVDLVVITAPKGLNISALVIAN